MEIYLIAGGDLRFIHLANLLSKDHTVYCIGFDSVFDFSERVKRFSGITDFQASEVKITHLILPLPASNDCKYVNAPLWENNLPLETLLNSLPKDTFILAGKVDEELKNLLESKNMKYIDYFAREELTVLNSVPTAEGTLQIAMEELPTTIYGTKCLITGYGRVGKYTGKLFHALGAHVTICVRKYSDMAWSKMYGCQSIHISKLKDVIENFDLIINTVPAKVFENDTLERIRKDALLIDLASKPGGVDFSMANNLGVRTIWALSLPGKTAPLTAGKIIYETIANILTEQKQ